MNKFSDLAKNLRDSRANAPKTVTPQPVTPALSDLVSKSQPTLVSDNLNAASTVPAETKSKKRIDRNGLKYTQIIKDLYDGVCAESILQDALDLVGLLYGDKTAAEIYKDIQNQKKRNISKELF